MTDNKPSYIEGIGWRYETLHSMHRRMEGHDYRDRSIYMITMAVEDRRPLLGVLRAKKSFPDEAYIEPTELGKEVQCCWLAIPEHYPDVKPLALQIMPDHIHGLLFVLKEQEAHLGKIINGFKIGCNKAYRLLYPEAVKFPEALPQEAGLETGQAMPREAKRPKHSEHGMLFEPGYQDSVLMGKGQLETMFHYIASNPYRLAMKREEPELFKVVRELVVKCPEALPQETTQALPQETEQALQQDAKPELRFAAIGNRWLLKRPMRMQVRCHNNESPENLRLIAKQKEYFLDRGRRGGVVVSPCISAGEKEIARAALDAGVPLIVILENGFPPMYKPPGKYFEACAKGLLLMLAPWSYHMEKRKITRQQCLELNGMAYALSTEPWTAELEAKVKYLEALPQNTKQALPQNTKQALPQNTKQALPQNSK